MNYYTLAISLILAVLMVLIICYFTKSSNSRKWNVVAGIIVVLVCSLIGTSLADNSNKERIKQQKECDAYCNCQITQNCSYTFDYNDVESCNCEVK